MKKEYTFLAVFQDDGSEALRPVTAQVRYSDLMPVEFHMHGGDIAAVVYVLRTPHLGKTLPQTQWDQVRQAIRATIDSLSAENKKFF